MLAITNHLWCNVMTLVGGSPNAELRWSKQPKSQENSAHSSMLITSISCLRNRNYNIDDGERCIIKGHISEQQSRNRTHVISSLAEEKAKQAVISHATWEYLWVSSISHSANWLRFPISLVYRPTGGCRTVLGVRCWVSSRKEWLGQFLILLLLCLHELPRQSHAFNICLVAWQRALQAREAAEQGADVPPPLQCKAASPVGIRIMIPFFPQVTQQSILTRFRQQVITSQVSPVVPPNPP